MSRRVFIILMITVAMKVPEPKWPGMILRCDENNKNCYWTCEWGVITIPERIDGNEIQVSTGCIKDAPTKVCPSCGNGNIFPFGTL